MLGQVGLERKGFAAVCARKGFVGGVGLRVRTEIAFVRKAFGTHAAGEGLFSGVGPDMTLEQPGAGEVFSAVGALAAGAVCAHVHGKRGWAGVLAVAVCTLPARDKCTVGLTVAG